MFDLSKLGQMMGQAQEMQKKLKDDLAKMAIRSSSGGGAVKVVINGLKELTHIEIDPQAIKDHEMLSDLILAALSAAYAEADQNAGSQMSNLLGGVDLSSISQFLKP